MTSKHTPGPWYLETTEDNYKIRGSMLVCMMPKCLSDPEVHQEVKANMNLILRACNSHEELVEALKTANRVLSHLNDVPAADPLKYIPTSAIKEAYQKTKQAIAKATGKEEQR